MVRYFLANKMDVEAKFPNHVIRTQIVQGSCLQSLMRAVAIWLEDWVRLVQEAYHLILLTPKAIYLRMSVQKAYGDPLPRL